MKKTILIISIFLFSSNQLFSQSVINIGVGVGQQFGFPGLRLGYKWNKLEGSLNYGFLGGIDIKNLPINYSKLDAKHKCLGLGLSFYIKEHFSISYTYGTVFFKTNDNYNISTQLQNTHTFCLNNELLYKHLKWRFGYGVGYSNEYQTKFNKFYPLLTLGCIFKIWQKKTDY